MVAIMMFLMTDMTMIKATVGERIALSRQIQGVQNALYDLEGAKWEGAAAERAELERQLAEKKARRLAMTRALKAGL
jgi:hypothetical protein